MGPEVFIGVPPGGPGRGLGDRPTSRRSPTPTLWKPLNPEIYQLFEQMKCHREIQGNHLTGQPVRSPRRSLSRVLRGQSRDDDKWLEGVEAADGTPRSRGPRRAT